MKQRSFRSFERRVGLFLALVITYLFVLQALHSYQQSESFRLLEREASLRAEVTASGLLDRLGEADLLKSMLAWRGRGAPPPPFLIPSHVLRKRGVSSMQLLSSEGWRLGVAVHTHLAEGRSRLTRPTATALGSLREGLVVVDTTSGAGEDLLDSVVTALVPIHTDRGELVGVLEVNLPNHILFLSRRNVRWNMIIQGVTLIGFCGLIVTFIAWTLRPLRLLDRSARAPDPETTAELAKQDDTGFVIETYRRMVEELQEKEKELRRLKDLERHRANELQDLNASIVDSMVSGILVLDLKGHVRTLNEDLRQILCLGPGRATGRPFQDVLTTAPELHSRLESCLEEGKVIRKEELRLNFSGVGHRDVDLTVSPLKDRDGQRRGAIAFIVDTTEIKLLHEQVRAKASLAELGELSAGIAHEFRNSLAAILGYAKLIDRQSQDDEALRDHALRICAEVNELRTVVDDFLRFANPTRLILETIDLAEVFNELSLAVTERAGDTPVNFEVLLPLPVITGDETLLRRVFTNLLRNAVDALETGGTVRVSCETAEGEVTIFVDDDGPGIPAEDRQRIFVPFVSRKEKGTGLGLALVRKVVVYHGGRIEVGDSPLGGARFALTLPSRVSGPVKTEDESA